MDYRLNRGLQREIHNHPDTAKLLVQAAGRFAARLAAATPTDTGRTRASTRVEGGHRSADGRSVAARVVQGGASVPQQWGNRRERTPARQFDRARGSL